MNLNDAMKVINIFMDWLVGLLASYNVWGTIIGALIGGMIALKIAKEQVESSRDIQEKQRISISNHERKLSVLKLRINECRDAMLALNELKSALSNYGAAMEELGLCVEENSRGQKVLSAQLSMSQETLRILDVITKTRMSIEVCGMSEETRNQIDEFSAVLSKMFDWGMKLNREKFLEGNEIIVELVTEVHNEFNKKAQDLIRELEDESV